MELTDATRSAMVISVKDLIESGVADNWKIEFYTALGTPIVSLPLATPCMTVTGGVGTFDDTSPYLRGTVAAGDGGTANRFKILDGDGTDIVSGACGDPSNTGRDIQFNTLDWADYDNITLTGLTLTMPAGSNNYIT